MKTLLQQPDFPSWRDAAREALESGYVPGEISFEDATVPAPLSLALDLESSPSGSGVKRPHVPRAFLDAAKVAAAHRDPQRWNLLYRILFRLQTEKSLLSIEVDADVAQLVRLEAQVRRDLHKMHAFVRFRKVLEAGDPNERPVVVDEPLPVDPDPQAHHLVLATPTPFGAVRTELEACPPPQALPDADCEHFIAWYEPDHRILELAAPFFAERFAILRWTIMTPDETVAWDPASKQLAFGPGLPRESATAEDELESLWRSYYSSIFNPARLNLSAMRSEMPVRYWKHLPEVSVIPDLVTRAQSRVDTMVLKQQGQPSAQPFLPAERSIPLLNAAMQQCRGCELYCNATQAVGGEGSPTSSLMLVGEQPGDQEDLQGLPFVGPAGKLLRRAMEELRIDPATLYVTNAVKHFKFVQRGKLRLHQNPRMSEIMACRPWLLAEIEELRPKLILCLGASASKSLLGGTFSLMRDRGKVVDTSFSVPAVATVHPSAVLRARDETQHRQLYSFLKDDLALAYEMSHR